MGITNKTMENKQTAVRWLQGQYYESEGKLTRKDFEQAKAMEKEQIIDAYESEQIFIWNAEEYYNETYNKQDNGK